MNMSEKELQRILRQPDYGIVGKTDEPLCDVKREQSMQAPESPLEAQFYQLWVVLGGPELAAQYKFEPTRGWIADFVHLDSKTIIEIDGGMYIGGVGGRHNRAHGYQRDRERDNWATMTGWRVIRLTSMMLTPDYVESIIKWIQEDEA